MFYFESVVASFQESNDLILSFIRDKLNTFNNTGARLLGSIYCKTLKLLLNRV